MGENLISDWYNSVCVCVNNVGYLIRNKYDSCVCVSLMRQSPNKLIKKEKNNDFDYEFV